ncbi:GMC family oxidoreductase N-terminal domain-containing protein [Agromyces aerolatus]|uniref:GMC family oxidoreductase N-terminal domain-containing protein n=1 Tax=Agromyces sp. LY-1074 TaxID=3074080 RepID=UPI00285CD0ED|nr:MULTISPECIES: GMC family oxidoreductase N-terminal domain-containing protein [unclassified Agromyces]MDR5700471.1 GMC family oxidoreductase N-terminal domain-containing protein [Agromyces sp. LY-1074]MDR5706992.1 GMC family oxidoreductase N-terminal domain-containing protein [Agromyces sp. LY-1358]
MNPRRTIVVGAGTAGAVLAARLSEDPERSVTLVEAGPTPRTAEAFPPGMLDASTVEGAMPGHPMNWSYLGHLTPDLPYTIARGRIAGGSSTINGGYFMRARSEDFARWSERAGPDWSFDRVLPVLRELERDLDLGAGPVHGDRGPMPVRRASQRNPVARAFAAAAHEIGFAEEPDKNAPGLPGVGPVPQNVIDGQRINTALAYLTPARDRPNLEVHGGCRVLRVRFEGTRAVGVEVEVAQGGRRELYGDEIVLCAGGIGTPHLLLTSGIGPAGQLRSLGIDVVHDATGVGRAFADHPEVSIGWRASRDVVDAHAPETFTTALNFSASGAGAGDLEVMACVTTTARLLTGSASTVAGGAKAALRHPVSTLRALRGASLRRVRDQVAHGRDLVLLVGLQHESARGSITLESADPTVQPRIDYHYLSTADDRERLRLGVRTAVALLRSRAFAGLFERLTELDDATLDDDAALDAWMLTHLGTAIHLCGSAPMGPASDPGAVADGFGRVHGVSGLRIADTSMLPDAPSRGPAATAVLIGELVARFMRRGD